MPNLLSPEVIRNPYPYYAELRRHDPVLWEPGFAGGAWIISSWEHVHLLLRDKRLSPDRIAVYQRFSSPERVAPIVRNLQGWMLFRDPPFHTRLRTLLAKSFTSRTVEGLRPKVVQLVDRLLHEASRGATCDVISQLAYPLPAQVIGALIGVDDSRGDELKAWSDRIAYFLGMIRGTDAAREAMVQIDAFLRGLIDERRRERRQDLLSSLLTVTDGNEAFTDDEVVSTCVMLLFAGHHTTMNLIGNGLYALLRDDAALERFRQRPDVTAIDELLRYDSPVQNTGRMALEDVEVAGKTIRKGEFVHLLLGAANRDPAVFREPDRLDLDRADNHHLAFGAGIHFCIGAPLARMEAPLLLGELVRRFPRLRLADGAAPEYLPNQGFRGLRSLPVALA